MIKALTKYPQLKIVKSVKTTGNEEFSWTCGILPRVNMSYWQKLQATSSKLQAPSSKLQAPSSKPQAPSVRQFVALTQDVAATLCHIDTRCSGATICHIDRSSKQQASSPKLQASSSKPQAASSLIREPRYMDIGKVFDALGPRAWAMINVLCGCFTWNAIWCGENFNFLPFVTFNSTVKKWPEVL